MLSPDHQWAAVTSSQRLVVLYEATSSFKAASSTFEVPLAQNQHGQLLEDPICSCRWSSNSQLLLVSCASSALYVLDRWVKHGQTNPLQQQVGMQARRRPAAVLWQPSSWHPACCQQPPPQLHQQVSFSSDTSELCRSISTLPGLPQACKWAHTGNCSVWGGALPLPAHP